METSNLHAEDKHGKTIVDYACISRDEQTVELVIGLDMNKLAAVNETVQWSPMHWACRKGSFERLELLNATGIRFTAVKTKQPLGIWTPLGIALHHNNRKLISEDGGTHDWRMLAPSEIVSQSEAKHWMK